MLRSSIFFIIFIICGFSVVSAVSAVKSQTSSSPALFSLTSSAVRNQRQLPMESRIKTNDIIKVFSQLEKVARQLPALWSGLFTRRETGLSRQIFDMIDIVTDVAMLTLIGIPVLGLVAVGATALQPLLGSAVNRKKREAVSPGFADRAGKAILYARNLYDILADLEETFDKYEIRSNDCQLRAICEVHRVGPNSDYKDFGDKIIDIVR